jgi:hypothetical protein
MLLMHFQVWFRVVTALLALFQEQFLFAMVLMIRCQEQISRRYGAFWVIWQCYLRTFFRCHATSANVICRGQN